MVLLFSRETRQWGLSPLQSPLERDSSPGKQVPTVEVRQQQKGLGLSLALEPDGLLSTAACLSIHGENEVRCPVREACLSPGSVNFSRISDLCSLERFFGDLFSGALSPELGWTSGTHLTGEGKTTWTGLYSVGEVYGAFIQRPRGFCYLLHDRTQGYNKQGALRPKLWEFSSKQMLKPMGCIKVKR